MSVSNTPLLLYIILTVWMMFSCLNCEDGMNNSYKNVERSPKHALTAEFKLKTEHLKKTKNRIDLTLNFFSFFKETQSQLLVWMLTSLFVVWKPGGEKKRSSFSFSSWFGKCAVSLEVGGLSPDHPEEWTHQTGLLLFYIFPFQLTREESAQRLEASVLFFPGQSVFFLNFFLFRSECDLWCGQRCV